jgi:hypothetical protein
VRKNENREKTPLPFLFSFSANQPNHTSLLFHPHLTNPSLYPFPFSIPFIHQPLTLPLLPSSCCPFPPYCPFFAETRINTGEIE